jgi:hypothetical protein
MNKISKTIFLTLFIVLVLIRFYRIDQIGVDGADEFFYWQTAYNWLHGNFELTEHFRPFIYWLYSKLFEVFGNHKNIIGIFNVTCDVLVGMGIVYLGYLLRRSVWVGLAAAISYFSLYLPISFARSGCVHAPSSLFLMAYLIYFFHYLKTLKKAFLFFAGFFLSVSWHIHPDLAVLGSAAALTIFYKNCSSVKTSSENYWESFFKDFITFLAGFFLVFFTFAMKFGTAELLNNLLYNHKTQSKNLSSGFVSRLMNFSSTYLQDNLGLSLLVLFSFALLIFLAKAKKGKLTSIELSLFLMPLSYLFFCSLLFARYSIPRLFIPIVPSVIIFIFLQLHDLAKQKALRFELIVLPLVLILLGVNYNGMLYPFNQSVSPYKLVEETFSPLMKGTGKYLITPITTRNIHTPLAKNAYLHGRGLYLSSTNELTLDQVIEKNNISYVWIADILYDAKVFGEDRKFSYDERLINLFGLDPSNYSLEKEKTAMRDYLIKRSALLVSKTPLGELYELR